MIQRQNFAWRKLALPALIMFSTLTVAACDDDSTGPDALEWQAALEGVGAHDAVSASAAVLSTSASFQADIDIEDAPAAEVFTWRVAAGTCATPGARVGNASQYPELTIAANGTAAAEATVTGALDDDEDYIVQVVDEAADPDVIVACGALERD